MYLPNVHIAAIEQFVKVLSMLFFNQHYDNVIEVRKDVRQSGNNFSHQPLVMTRARGYAHRQKIVLKIAQWFSDCEQVFA